MPRNPNKIDYSRGFPERFEAFEKPTDTRKDGYTKHHFGEIIFMAFTCIVCGIKSYELMEEFCEIRSKWFEKWLTLPNGIPSYNTFEAGGDYVLCAKGNQGDLHQEILSLVQGP